MTGQSVTLVVLAGGEGSRMGSPKANLVVRERPILQYLSEKMAWKGPRMLVTAPGRENPPGKDHYDCEHIDPVRGIGPLRGILTALEHLTTPVALVLTVDMPAIRPKHGAFLIDQLTQRRDALGIMLQRPLDGNPHIEVFPCVFRRAAMPVIASRLALGRRSVYGLLEEPGFMRVDAPVAWSARTWTNLNSPADLAQFNSHEGTIGPS